MDGPALQANHGVPAAVSGRVGLLRSVHLRQDGRQQVPHPPAWLVKKPFREIIGREMPEDAAKITPEESLRYMREMLARQFHRIQEAIHEGHPGTKTFYNPPFYRPAEPLWVDHPMLNECDMLNAESSDDVVPWLLKIRKPKQRVMTVIVGRPDGVCYPATWKRWFRRAVISSATPGRSRPISVPIRDTPETWRSSARRITKCRGEAA